MKSNTVTVSAETIMQLEDGVSIVGTVAIGDACTAILNQWNAVIIYPATNPSAGIAGVPCKILAGGAYLWEQTRGVASCLSDGSTSVLVGNSIRPSKDHAGAVELNDETAVENDFQSLGYALSTAPDTEFGLYFLQIE